MSVNLLHIKLLLSIYLSVYQLSIYLSIYQSIYQFINLSTYLYIMIIFQLSFYRNSMVSIGGPTQILRNVLDQNAILHQGLKRHNDKT